MSTGYVAAFDDDDEDTIEICKETKIIDEDNGYRNWGWWRYNLILVEMKKSKSNSDYVRMKQASIA